MKNLFLFISLMLLAVIQTESFAQAPGKFNYQAVIRDSDGHGIVNQNVDIRFQLFDAPVLGSEVFEEEFVNINTGNFGVVNLQLGGHGNVDLKKLNWATENYFINIQMRQGATPYADISNTRTQLVSVPFALFAQKADTASYAFTTQNGGGNADGNLISAIIKGDSLLLTVSNGMGGQNSFNLLLPAKGDKWGDQVVLKNTTLKGTGAGSDSLGIADMGATQGQVLKYNNGRWRPGTDLSSGTVMADNQTIEGDGTTGNLLRIKNLGVTNSKLAANSITTDKIANGEVGSQDISDMGADDGNVLTYGPSGWAPQPVSAGNSPWTKTGDNVYVNNGELVGIGTSTPSSAFTIKDGNMSMLSGNNEVFSLSGQNGYGFMSLMDPSSNAFIYLNTNPIDPGILMTNANNQNYVTLTPLALDISHSSGGDAGMSIHPENQGYMSTTGNNGNLNVRITNPVGFPNSGYVAVYDENGIVKSGMYVNDLGQGVSFADVKNFRMQHPRDPNKEIWYASLEGPEAAAYERGTGTLQNGEAFIPFSDHFQLVINPQTATVILTPQSADTYGLAVIEKLENGIRVKELKGGTGNFKFDWEVKGVRKGYEGYLPVREKGTATPQ